MFEILAALFPWFFLSALYLAWVRLFVKSFSRKAQLFLTSAVFLLAQIIGTSLVLGILHLYTWQIVYAVNALIFVVLLFFASKRNLERLSLISWWKQLHLENKILLSFVSLFFVTRIVLAFVISDVSFDAVNYHMAWVGHAIQEQHLGPFDTPVPWINSYPKNLSLFYGWFILPPVNSMLVDLAQLPFVFLGVAASYLVLIRLKFSERISLFSSLLFSCIPLVVLQSTTNYIDLALGALVLSLFAFALNPKQSKVSLLAFALVAGILLGSKATMLIPVIFAAGFLLYSLYHQEKMPFGSLIKAIGVMAFVTACFSAYWYGRNLLVFGDLLYPVKVVVAGITLVPGVVTADMLIGDSMPDSLKQAGFLKTLFLNFYHEGGARYDMSPGGFGPLWAWFLFPSMLPALYLWIKKRNWQRLSLFIVFWFIFFLSPGNWWLRYVLAFVFTGILAYAEALSQAKNKPVLYKVFVVATFSLVTMNFLQSAKPFFLTKEYFSSKLVSVTQADYSYRYGEIHHSIAEITVPGTTIAYDSSWFVIYPLWNEKRINRVLHIPVQKNWLEVLKENQVDYLAVKSDSPEYQFIQLQSGHFSLLFQEGIYFLYQLN